MASPIKRVACTVKAVFFMGHFQGMEVRLRGQRFPRTKQHVYTTDSILGAVEAAFREKAGLPANNDATKPIATELNDKVEPKCVEAADQWV